MAVKKLPFDEFKQIYAKVPRLCVDLIINSKDGVLLTKRDIPPALGFWHFPGGTILKNESVKEALERIADEELGIKIEIDKFLSFIEYSPEYAFGQSIALAFLVKQVSGTIHGSSQAREFGFFKTAPDNLIPEMKEFLEKNNFLK